MPSIEEDTTTLGGLVHDYDDDIHDANQQGRTPTDTSDDWNANLPPDKLWTHPDLGVAPAALCDPDEHERVANGDAVEFECPVAGCGHPFRVVGPLSYGDLRGHDGVINCPDCDEPVAAHQQPPRDWQRGPGRGLGPGGGRP